MAGVETSRHLKTCPNRPVEKAGIATGLALGRGLGKGNGVELIDKVLNGTRIENVKVVVKGRVPGTNEIGVTFRISSSNLTNDRFPDSFTDMKRVWSRTSSKSLSLS